MKLGEDLENFFNSLGLPSIKQIQNLIQINEHGAFLFDGSNGSAIWVGDQSRSSCRRQQCSCEFLAVSLAVL